jgi:hypothetical protein
MRKLQSISIEDLISFSNGTICVENQAHLPGDFRTDKDQEFNCMWMRFIAEIVRRVAVSH